MRNEKEMFELILGVANADERIRAVYLNGSRTNKNVQADIFQDYDVVYVVKETASFAADHDWIDVFGERLYMQMPEAMDKMLGHPYDFENCYGWLIQLADGNRIDLHVQSIPLCQKEVLADKLTIILLDKDAMLPKIPPATDEDYWVKKPTQEQFFCCCNEFWWIQNNIGKGLWRDEIPYVMDMLNIYDREQLVRMLSWKIGILTDFSCSVGKNGKYFKTLLPKAVYEKFIKTYPCGEIEKIWEAIFIMCGLFEETAIEVADTLNLKYDIIEGRNCRMFLENTKNLSRNAKSVI